MRTTIDKAGRVVIPRELREEAGLVPGPVDVHLVGNAIHIAVPESEIELELVDGFLTINGTSGLTDDDLRAIRLRLQDPIQDRGKST